MKRIGPAAMLAVVSTALAACQSAGPIGGNVPVVARGGGIEGNWVDANGITSSFNSGVFVTRTTDTNEKLAEGNYRYETPQLVAIDMRSLVRGTTSRVNCAVVSPSQLNCTSSAGSQFTLTRKAAG
ncbi:outer membrane lipoprotein Omp10 [Phyllobacterium phragmitis]|uniref:Outer membrane lipoprotein Omp10 n=1 Tax=Phyllobacterium phragmitis TaxID=2670329 RepID=A0ABQ0H287_9HYPH